jgi:ATPase family associated with various cellular activities (AAA)
MHQEQQDNDDASDKGSEPKLATHLVLPSRKLEGQWYPQCNTGKALSLTMTSSWDCSTTSTLRCCSVTKKWTPTSLPSIELFSCMGRRVFIVYTGTGKTTLCRGLAQTLSIRLSDRYSLGRLVEINAHSLFSKFFSESGKLVQKLFTQLHEILEDEDAFVCLLMGSSN